MKPMPRTPSEWLEEIAAAFLDAEAAIPFGKFVEHRITKTDLFHLAPSVCLKFRNLKRTAKRLKTATEAALSSYVATDSQTEGIFAKPHLSFAFCYLASHYGLDLLADNEIANIMDFLEAEEARLSSFIEELRRSAPGI